MNHETRAIAGVLGHEALAILRIALRSAAYYDLIGNREDFAILYRRLGGEAEIESRPPPPATPLFYTVK